VRTTVKEGQREHVLIFQQIICFNCPCDVPLPFALSTCILTTLFFIVCLMDGSYHTVFYFCNVLSILEPSNYSGSLDHAGWLGSYWFVGIFVQISAICLLQLSIIFLSRLGVACMHVFSCMCAIFWSNFKLILLCLISTPSVPN